MTEKAQEKVYLIKPLTKEHWQDFEALFGDKGAYGGCWCMFWRMKRSEFMKSSGEDRKQAMNALVNSGTIPGLLLYEGDKPIGWCSVGPREQFYPLERSKTLLRVDDQPVWSLVCFYIDRKFRKHGVMTLLIQSAIDFVKAQGGQIIEAYPTDMQSAKLGGKNLTGYHGFMGIASAFRKAGFVEVGRANDVQLIMRYKILE